MASLSRIPSFRRRFKNLVKLLYLEAVQAKASDNHIGEILASKNGDRNSVQNDDKEVREETANKAEYMTNDKENVV